MDFLHRALLHFMGNAANSAPSSSRRRTAWRGARHSRGSSVLPAGGRGHRERAINRGDGWGALVVRSRKASSQRNGKRLQSVRIRVQNA
ncbi:unnamed protein product [[Actinomadura] parvosata subsp. kistnae]|nr:unnamed protein product [Actinomadura parvosata subsp. kistnae]